MDVLPCLLQGVLHGDGGNGVEVGVPFGAHAVRHDLSQRRHAELLGPLLRRDDDRGPAVGDLGGVPRGDRSARLERRLQPAQRLRGGVRPDALVAGHHDRVALPLWDLDRNDLLGHPPGLPGVLGAPV